jgi:hypothetical protein
MRSVPGSTPGPLPFVIGVTGHRDLRAADLPVLEQTVRRAIEQIRDRFPHTPLIVLSQLAEGADRLVSQVALDLGLSMIVPLPMPQAEYEKDFDKPGSLDDFRSLLGQSNWHFVVPGAEGEELTGLGGNARSQRYALAGAFIAQSSQILLALWDGVDSNKVGGTSQVVQYARQGVPRPLADVLKGTTGPISAASSLDEPVGQSVVYHIPTPRVSNADPQGGSPAEIQVSYPQSNLEPLVIQKRFERIFARIDEFNRDHQHLAQRLLTSPESRTDALLPDELAGDLPPDLASIRDHYIPADALAREYQRLTRFAQQVLFLLVFMAVVAFGLYAHIEPLREPPMVLLYLALLGLTYVFWFIFVGHGEDEKHTPWVERVLAVIFRWIRRGDYQNKHLDYRALAEGLRIQFYWRLAALEDRVEDHYLSKHRTELDWIRIALQNWRLVDHQAGTRAGSQPHPTGLNALAAVLTHWVKGQREYFIGTVHRDDAKLTRSERFVRIFLLLGIAIAIASIFVLHNLNEWGEGLLLVAAGLAPVTAALIHNYAEKQALAEHIKQYERMSILFANAEKRLDESIHAGDSTLARNQLRDLGKEALNESADWVLLHRERPLEVPSAG